MAKLTVKRGTSEDLKKQALQDGLLSFTYDDGRIHLDYLDNNVLKRKTFYSGILTFGPHTFDGTKDVTVKIYNGESE